MLYLTDEEVLKDKDPAALTTVTDRSERIALCKACPKLGNSLGFDICTECSCIISFKTFFKLSSCPLSKWVIDENDLPRA